MGQLRQLARSKMVRVTAAVVVLAAGVLVGVDVSRASATYPVNAVYASAPGLFPGAAVDVLGVPVGTVTSVRNVDDRVEVGMRVHSGIMIPTGAEASLVSPEVLGQPDVDLNPGYTGGPILRPGGTIPESRTTVPVSTDQLLKQLQRTLQAINPHAVGDLISNLAQDLDGQGAGLNQLISSAAGTIKLLADKGDDLGQLNGTLAQLTGTLDTDTANIVQLVNEYDTVSTVVAQHSGQLNDAISQLSGATSAIVTLLTPNLAPLESDVGTVTTAGRTLDRNIGNVDEILQQTNNLFQGAQRVFNPTYNWLDLNAALPAGVSGDYVAGLIRDRLAGICRRIAANHSAGLPASTLATLNSCGNPASGFFDPLIGEIPTILSSLSSSGTGASTESSLLAQGMDQIGAIGSTPGTTTAPTPAAASPSTGGGTATTTPTTTTTTVPPSGLCGLLNSIIGCSNGQGSGSGSSSSSSSSSGGLGGLLSDPVKSSGQKRSANVVLAGDPSTGPSLSVPAARLLPPLPPKRTGHRGGHGWLDRVAHDVWGWW